MRIIGHTFLENRLVPFIVLVSTSGSKYYLIIYQLSEAIIMIIVIYTLCSNTCNYYGNNILVLIVLLKLTVKKLSSTFNMFNKLSYICYIQFSVIKITEVIRSWNFPCYYRK